jgi:hypothetical protein
LAQIFSLLLRPLQKILIAKHCFSHSALLP